MFQPRPKPSTCVPAFFAEKAERQTDRNTGPDLKINRVGLDRNAPANEQVEVQIVATARRWTGHVGTPRGEFEEWSEQQVARDRNVDAEIAAKGRVEPGLDRVLLHVSIEAEVKRQQGMRALGKGLPHRGRRLLDLLGRGHHWRWKVATIPVDAHLIRRARRVAHRNAASLMAEIAIAARGHTRRPSWGSRGRLIRRRRCRRRQQAESAVAAQPLCCSARLSSPGQRQRR